MPSLGLRGQETRFDGSDAETADMALSTNHKRSRREIRQASRHGRGPRPPNRRYGNELASARAANPERLVWPSGSNRARKRSEHRLGSPARRGSRAQQAQESA